MWVARNKDGTLKLTNSKPYRKEFAGEWFTGREFDGDYIYIDKSLFQNLEWDDEPIEVKLIQNKIDEKKLNELAHNHCMNVGYSNLDENEYIPIDNTKWGDVIYDITEAYKTGYTRAKRE